MAGVHAVDLLYTQSWGTPYAVLHEKSREAVWCDASKRLKTDYASKAEPRKR
jgi:hypothetical protein